MSVSSPRPSWFALVLLGLLGTGAQAEAAEPITLTLKNNRFEPSAETAPAGERLEIEVRNEDNTPAEFESSDLRLEKIIAPGGRVTVRVGPLKPRVYKFFDEYHPDTAQGTLTVIDKGQ